MGDGTLNNKTKSKWKWLRITLIILLVFVLAVAVYLFTVYRSAKSTIDDKAHEAVESIDNNVSKRKVGNKESLNILLLGVDKREGDRGRSDTMMVMTIDPKNSRTQLLSIPRDTRTEIVGKGKTDKINHAYAFGESEMSVATVEKFLDIDLDYYVRVNMEGLKQVVEAVGGVTVDNPFDFSSDGHHFSVGTNHLNGEEALSYVRMRKKDPAGDAGRNERQRQVIQGVVKNGMSVTSVTKIHHLIGILGDNMGTNMKFEDMKTLSMNYKNAVSQMDTYQITGQGAKIDGIWYLLVSDEEIAKTKLKIEEYGG